MHGRGCLMPLTLSPRLQVRLLVADVSFEALEQVLKGVHVDDTVRLTTYKGVALCRLHHLERATKVT